jgi:structure-specific endonuclease subunit SLX1
MAHLSCLAEHFSRRRLLPQTGTCPRCLGRLDWGQIIRSCYARKAKHEEPEAKKRRKARHQVETRSEEQIKGSVTSSDDEQYGSQAGSA